MAKKEKSETQSTLPASIVMDETIGWMENGVLRQFKEGQIVTVPEDIRKVIEAGALYREVL
jgi:hypothetical protein